MPPSARAHDGPRIPRDYPSLWTVTLTELARMRRGFLPMYALLAPIVIAVPLYLGSLFSPEGAPGHTWQVFSHVTLEFWGVLVPMTAGLTTALSVRADQDAWRLMFSYAVPRWRYLVGKFAALSMLNLVSSTVLLVILAGGAALNGTFKSAAGNIFAASYLPWAGGLATTALALLISMMWGLGPGIAVGIAGLFSGALIADKSFWYAIPSAWPMRVILPVAGISPNGIALPPHSPLADTSVIPLVLTLSVSLMTVVLVAGSLHMNKKEV